jgi:hypothetical protein
LDIIFKNDFKDSQLFTMNRLVILFFICFLLAFPCLGQYNIVDPKSIINEATPLSPDVANMDRYTMSPPNLSNGLPQQNIPLFEFKENGISFSTDLFYNYSGFRVKEEATSIGLGWGLTDAMIVREVKHVPDDHMGLMKKFEDCLDDYQEEMGAGVTESMYSYSGSGGSYHNITYNRQFYKYYDAQPDVYVINFGGYTGKFFWLNNKAVKIDQNDLIIEGEGTPGNGFQFIITTPDGVRYKFIPADYTEITPANIIHPLQCNTGVASPESYTDTRYTTAWRLSEIKSNVTQEVITLKYTTSYSVQEKTVDQAGLFTLIAPQQIDGNFFINNYQVDQSYTKIVSSSWLIDEIESSHYKAVYVTGNRLDNENKTIVQINIFNKQNLQVPVRTINFSHGYFGDVSTPDNCWLKLSQVQIQGGGADNKYSFFYVDENAVPSGKSSLAIDHWGYYNSAGNTSLVPLLPDIQNKVQTNSNINISFVPFGNRNVDFYSARKFALEKVIYPTQGYSQKHYESTSGKGIRVKSQDDNDGKSIVSKYYDYGATFTYPAIYTPAEFLSYQNCGSHVVEDGGIAPDLPINVKSYTYGSSPDQSNEFFRRQEPFYETVTENIGSPDGQGGKTVYHFVQINSLGSEVIMTEKDQYKFGENEPVSKETYDYGLTTLKTIRYWQTPILYSQLVPSAPCHTDGSQQVVCGPADPDKGYILQDIYTQPLYISTYWKHLDKVGTTAQGVYSEKKFFYNTIDLNTGLPKNTLTVKVEQLASNGNLKSTYLYYPGDIDPDNSSSIFFIPEMWDRGSEHFAYYTGSVVKTKTFNNNSLVSKETSLYSYDPVNNLILKTGYEGLPVGLENGKVKWALNYDSKGNLTQAAKENDIPKSVLWSYNKLYTIAETNNATNGQVAYTSFENTEDDTWTGINPVNIQDEGKASITGSKSYLLTNSNLQKTVAASVQYTVSYWSKNGSYNINGTAARQGRTAIINGKSWTYYEHDVSGVSAIIVTGAGTIDELRAYPSRSQMNTYTYDLIKGMTSKADIASHITYYEYDNVARLRIVRDQGYNIIRSFCYAYSGQPESCTCISSDANWQNTNTAPRCQLTNGTNTGYQEQEQRDNNVCSTTYNQTRWINGDYTPSICQIVCTNCTASPDKRCITGVCETGLRVCTDSYFDTSMGEFRNVFHYEFSDGSWSDTQYEYASCNCDYSICN